ncbi:MAG: hypothetical protein ACE5HB_06275 [Terriglobia bacterium]
MSKAPGRNRPVVAAALLLSGLPAPALLAATGEPAPEAKSFPMKYERGTEPIPPGTKLKVTLGRERILVRGKDGQGFSIPVAAVLRVDYFARTNRRSAPITREVGEQFRGVACLGKALKHEAKAFGRGFYKYGKYYHARLDYERSYHDYWIALERAYGRHPECANPIADATREADWKRCAKEAGKIIQAEKRRQAAYERMLEERLELQEERVKLQREEEKLYESCEPAHPLAATVVAAVGLPVAAVLAPFKTTKHFVLIVWDENGERRRVAFKVGKGEYKAFLQALNAVAPAEPVVPGTPWQPQLKRRAKRLASSEQNLPFLAAQPEGRKLEPATLTSSWEPQLKRRRKTMLALDLPCRLLQLGVTWEIRGRRTNICGIPLDVARRRAALMQEDPTPTLQGD